MAATFALVVDFGGRPIDPVWAARWSKAGTLHLDGNLAIISDRRTTRLSTEHRTVIADWGRRPPPDVADELAGAGSPRETIRHLDGERAIVSFDRRRRIIHAARDAFGTRPLFYARRDRRFGVATDIELLWPLGPEWSVDVDSLLDLLTYRFGERDATLFEGIRRVPPGHQLYADDRRATVERWFYPPSDEHPASDREGAVRELRRLLERAVERRIEGSDRIAVQASGGLDSSTVALIADERRSPDGLIVASGVFPGLPCDEARFVDALSERLRAPLLRYDATAPDPDPLDSGGLAHPWRAPDALTNRSAWRLARGAGAERVLTGLGGDELLFERGAYRDLLRSGSYWTFLKETIGRRSIYSSRPPRFYFADALRSLLPRRPWRRPPPPPDWLGPELARRWGSFARKEETNAQKRGSETATITWRWLTGTSMALNLEMLVEEAKRFGVELAFPYLDRDLADHVLRLPPALRFPHGGRMKHILREAFADRLPPSIRDRRSVTGFSPIIERRIEEHRSALAAVAGEPWISERLLNAAAVRRHLGFETWWEKRTAWDLVMCELWLRRLRGAGVVRVPG